MYSDDLRYYRVTWSKDYVVSYAESNPKNPISSLLYKIQVWFNPFIPSTIIFGPLSASRVSLNTKLGMSLEYNLG